MTDFERFVEEMKQVKREQRDEELRLRVMKRLETLNGRSEKEPTHEKHVLLSV